MYFIANQMAAHIRGSKRLMIIQNYLNGKEDDEWNVLPTKKEGRYIVKRRTEPIAKTKEEQPEEPKEESVEEEPKPIPKPTPPPQQPVYDPTINIEILDQFKLLGEEIKTKREKNEQKRIIKKVVHKQMMKQPRFNYTQPQYIQEPNDVEQVEQINDPQPNTPPLTIQPLQRRNNIFSDIY